MKSRECTSYSIDHSIIVVRFNRSDRGILTGDVTGKQDVDEAIYMMQTVFCILRPTACLVINQEQWSCKNDSAYDTFFTYHITGVVSIEC